MSDEILKLLNTLMSKVTNMEKATALTQTMAADQGKKLEELAVAQKKSDEETAKVVKELSAQIESLSRPSSAFVSARHSPDPESVPHVSTLDPEQEAFLSLYHGKSYILNETKYVKMRPWLPNRAYHR